MKRLKYLILGIAGSGVLALGTAAYKDDFKLGQNIELLVNSFRAVYLYYVDETSSDDLAKNAVAGLVSELDPYTELFHADENDAFELMTTGKYGGIGALIRQRGDTVLVAEPYKGTPSDRAGLKIGDAFVRIGDKGAVGLSTKDVSDALKGDPGTDVTVTVRKLATGRSETLTIRREAIRLPSVPYYGVLGDSIGYIHHSDFTEGSAQEVKRAFLELKARGINRLILDYRSNGGGILQEAVAVLSIFVPRGTEVVSMRGRGAGTDRTYRTQEQPLDTHIPIAVLVDGHSASAAEIVAGALQDLDRGVLIGQRTFGKGLVQSTLPVGGGSTLKVTTAKYYIPSGRCIQAIDYSHQRDSIGVRVVPDSLVKEFHTAAGRKVYDGGGVMPDVRMEPEYNSRFAMVVYAKGFVDDFADRWMVSNVATEVKPGFRLTEKDWAAFVGFLADKDLDYRSATDETLSRLRGTAEYERLMTPELKAELDRVAALLAGDNEANLRLYRSELEEILENAIVLRRLYSAGVSEHNLPKDPDTQEAIKVLNNKKEYTEILTSRDTDKK